MKQFEKATLQGCAYWPADLANYFQIEPHLLVDRVYRSPARHSAFELLEDYYAET